MADFQMPSLGADMAAGRLVEWLVAPGDAVKRGDLVAVVETDKGAMEIEFFEDGVIESLVVEEDTKVPVGTVLATFRPASGSGAPASSSSSPDSPTPAAAPAAPVVGTTAPAPVQPPPPQAGGILASPAARRAAQQRGIELASLQGSGPSGAIVLADLPPEDASSGMRAAIARAMERSNREIPHYYLGTEIDLQPALDWLTAHNADRPVTERVLYAALLIKAVALACQKHPALNGWHLDGALRPGPGIHVGVAVSLKGGGLIAPAIHDADQLSPDTIMARLADLVERARSGRLRRAEVTEGTITVTNLGQRGVPVVYPLIQPPQVAIVGFGRVSDRPWVVDGQIVVRPIISCTLAADHRATDGHEGGLFLRRIESLLRNPRKLVG